MIIVGLVCVGAAAVIIAVMFGRYPRRPAVTLPGDTSIVLITIDTLRADHMSCYGYGRRTTPNIDRLAGRGVRFSRALAPSSWTPPSVASIITARYPLSHGILHGIVKEYAVLNQEVLGEQFETLAEALKKQGYTTFGAVANVHMSRELGFGQGFDYYHCEGFEHAAQLRKVVLNWREQIQQADKFFLWVHFFDPHDPYYPRIPWIRKYSPKIPQGFAATLAGRMMDYMLEHIAELRADDDSRQYLIDLYDSEINFVDFHMEKLLGQLELEKEPLVVVSSDHGEELLDRGGLGHGFSLQAEQVHVPLIFAFPETVPFEPTLPRIDDRPVSLVDIMPTVLGLLGAPVPPGVMGVNLFGGSPPLPWQGRSRVFSDLMRVNVIRAIVDGNWKYIYNYCTLEEGLYDVSVDPAERHNLAGQYRRRADTLRAELLAWVEATPRAKVYKKELAYALEIQDKLQALGYIKDDSSVQPEDPGCSVKLCH